MKEFAQESYLKESLRKKGTFSVDSEGGAKLELSIIGVETSIDYPEDFVLSDTIFGQRPQASKSRKVRFDLIARPTSKNNALYIIELKAGEIALGHVNQLVSYVALLRNIQEYGGQGGLLQLKQIFSSPISSKTEILGLLIGKQVSNGQFLWIPKETWNYIRFCAYEWKQHPGLNNDPDLKIYDMSGSFKAYCKTMWKIYNEAINFPG